MGQSKIVFQGIQKKVPDVNTPGTSNISRCLLRRYVDVERLPASRSIAVSALT
jgi:hypothetical protein